ncbi:MAG: hypothetical protein AAGJ46_16065 [Planctomycetota bacterium]
MKPGILMLVAIAALSALAVRRQTIASQNYRVTAPTNLSITATPDATITHDDRAFAPKQWTVRGNTLAGVSVSFAAGDYETAVTAK